MKAMIFAAGLGTRLKPLTDTMPKALVPVAGKPLLEHVLLKLKANGFDDVVINVHHFADMIEEWCAAHPIEGMKVSFSDERQELLETGGGIRHAAPLLKEGLAKSSFSIFGGKGQSASSRFLIHNVDILSNVDLQAFWQAGEGSDATLLVSERETQRYLIFNHEMRLVGWTNIKTGEVKSPFPEVHEAFNPDFVGTVNSVTARLEPYEFVPSRHSFSLYAFAGIHQMDTSMLPLMDRYPDKFSIIDFYLEQCRHCVIRGFIQPDLRLMDVGKIDTLDQAEQFLNS